MPVLSENLLKRYWRWKSTNAQLFICIAKLSIFRVMSWSARRAYPPPSPSLILLPSAPLTVYLIPYPRESKTIIKLIQNHGYSGIVVIFRIRTPAFIDQ